MVGGDLSPLISRYRDSFPPKGKPFARFLSYYATKDEESIYTRPHPSPTVTPSPSKGKASEISANNISFAVNDNTRKRHLIKKEVCTIAFPFEGEGGAEGGG